MGFEVERLGMGRCDRLIGMTGLRWGSRRPRGVSFWIYAVYWNGRTHFSTDAIEN